MTFLEECDDDSKFVPYQLIYDLKSLQEQGRSYVGLLRPLLSIKSVSTAQNRDKDTILGRLAHSPKH